MGVVGGIAGPGLERKAAGDDLAIRRIDGIQDRLFQGIRVEETGEGDRACGNDNGMMN